MYRLLSEGGELRAEVTGRFRHSAAAKADYPGVGDWVAAELQPDQITATIHAVLPRTSCFRRKVTRDRTEAQVVAANIDVVLVVASLDGGRNFNPRRLERYLALAWDSGAMPVIVLNKIDVCPDVEAQVAATREVAYGIPICPISATRNLGLETVREHMGVGRTATVVGPSGVGKSSIVNALAGDALLATQDNRDGDRRGRHTTTRRELIVLPATGVIIDTPGMRELQLWGDETDTSLKETFADIHDLAAACRFTDCTHRTEPGCAVQRAMEDGSLEPVRYENYTKLNRELAYLARRKDQRAQKEEKAKWKAVSKAQKRMRKNRE
jgi:ribosome biogenesis GTPase